MRRFFVVVAGLGIMSSGIACHHTAGKCDCNPITPPCAKYGLYTSEPAVIHHSAQPVRDVTAPKTPAAGESLPPAPMPQPTTNVVPPAPAPGGGLSQ